MGSTKLSIIIYKPAAIAASVVIDSLRVQLESVFHYMAFAFRERHFNS
jgi:hypothetical protein